MKPSILVGAFSTLCIQYRELDITRAPRNCAGLERVLWFLGLTGSWWALQFIAAITVLLPWPVQAQDSNSGTTAPTRPSIMFNRWQEDWSVLADPRVPREPLDGFKYIPLSAYDPKTYVSFGGDFRDASKQTMRRILEWASITASSM